ncbi:MAG: acetyl-CoA carboxylase biotin carboxyl carrier protein [Clostridiaceae bacterium]|nr:acetyl-CoA carboxylase biotin carboxyl carrier protein [Clostridiaceae bacterium]
MNYNELKQLTFELIDKLAVSEIENVTIEFEQAKIQLSKQGCRESKAITKIELPTPPVNQKAICSPMVGTFYAAPSPDEKPFVNVGDTISKGDTICIIEAMKLMNEIVADKSGVIKEILINNGDIVEYNQPIFIIE